MGKEDGGSGMKPRLLDLFSGIGGFSLGLERAGFETVQFVEINPACQRVLRHHWPKVPIHEDITTFEPSGPVDVVTAGFPCQDISSAGKCAGLAGANSGLFWHVVRTLRMVGPAFAILENVAALLNRGMGTVLGALAESGRDAEWDCIRASDVGAPHGRNRVWIIAHPERNKQPRQEPCFGTFGRVGRIEQPMAWDRDWAIALSALRRMDDGLSRSVDRTDGCRNAVVPQIPELLGRAWLEAQE